MSWIKEISFKEATGTLAKLYKRVQGPNHYIDNILSVHSLRPHTLAGHMALYKNVLHHTHNTLPKWYLESVGVYVSMLNKCPDCVDHHAAGLKRLLEDERQYERIWESLEKDMPHDYFEGKLLKGLLYAKKLTQAPGAMEMVDKQVLTEVGFSDGELLELNQVTSYFNYANRTVLGLGVNTEGDILGLSPNDESDSTNWGHQ